MWYEKSAEICGGELILTVIPREFSLIRLSVLLTSESPVILADGSAVSLQNVKRSTRGFERTTLLI